MSTGSVSQDPGFIGAASSVTGTRNKAERDLSENMGEIRSKFCNWEVDFGMERRAPRGKLYMLRNTCASDRLETLR
jgi:hypothetical protein